MIFTDIKNGRFYNEDCFDAMKEIPNGVIDMILCDLPYGTTQNKWDSVLPLDKLWAEYWRICKGVIVLTCNFPFTAILANSELNSLKDALVWDKKGTTGFQLAKKRPLRRHEDILIFSKTSITYNPIMEIRGEPRKKGGSKIDNGCYGELRSAESFNNEYYPTSILEISNAAKNNKIHPTQKPVALFEYLIKTYTNENEIILDNTAGSGTTAIAAINTNRKWVCIEKEKEYYDKAINRIWNHEIAYT